jgi:hypothetical protein
MFEDPKEKSDLAIGLDRPGFGRHALRVVVDVVTFVLVSLLLDYPQALIAARPSDRTARWPPATVVSR